VWIPDLRGQEGRKLFFSPCLARGGCCSQVSHFSLPSFSEFSLNFLISDAGRDHLPPPFFSIGPPLATPTWLRVFAWCRARLFRVRISHLTSLPLFFDLSLLLWKAARTVSRLPRTIPPRGSLTDPFSLHVFSPLLIPAPPDTRPRPPSPSPLPGSDPSFTVAFSTRRGELPPTCLGYAGDDFHLPTFGPSSVPRSASSFPTSRRYCVWKAPSSSSSRFWVCYCFLRFSCPRMLVARLFFLPGVSLLQSSVSPKIVRGLIFHESSPGRVWISLPDFLDLRTRRFPQVMIFSHPFRPVPMVRRCTPHIRIAQPDRGLKESRVSPGSHRLPCALSPLFV